MAEVVVGDGVVSVRLRRRERVAALRHDVTVPRSAVRGAHVVDRPFEHLRGLRLPGTAVPWSIAYGTWRGRGYRDFVAVHARRPALVMELDPEAADGWSRLLVSVADPASVAEQLAS